MKPGRALSKLEQSLEFLVEQPLGRVLRRSIQPADIGRRLERELRAGQFVSVRGRIAPNQFTVLLNPADLAEFQDFQSTLTSQFEEWLGEISRDHRLATVGAITVSFAPEPSVSRGHMEVEARVFSEPEPAGTTEQFEIVRPAAPLDQLEVEVDNGRSAGSIFAIRKSISSIGRDLSNDIVLDCPEVSRQHAELEHLDGVIRVVDLFSTNGTFVNGRRVASWSLVVPGDQITFGTVRTRLDRTY